MPRKGRSSKGLGSARVNISNALGTLADTDVISVAQGDTTTEEVYAISLHAVWQMKDHTAGEGPIICGVCHSDLASQEIEDYLEATTSWDQGDILARELQSRGRFIREVGTFNGSQGTEEVLNDGKPVKTKLGFRLETGKTLKAWAWNKSGGALTTGTIVETQGKCWYRRT